MWPILIPDGEYPEYKNLHSVLTDLSIKYKVGTDAIAMPFCMDNFPNGKALSSANNKTHLQANLRANDSKLFVEEINKLLQQTIAATAYWNERKS